MHLKKTNLLYEAQTVVDLRRMFFMLLFGGQPVFLNCKVLQETPVLPLMVANCLPSILYIFQVFRTTVRGWSLAWAFCRRTKNTLFLQCPYTCIACCLISNAGGTELLWGEGVNKSWTSRTLLENCEHACRMGGGSFGAIPAVYTLDQLYNKLLLDEIRSSRCSP